MSCIGRGGQIRTDDPLLPKQMRYQAALRPDFLNLTAPAIALNSESSRRVLGVNPTDTSDRCVAPSKQRFVEDAADSVQFACRIYLMYVLLDIM